jgi:ABC-type sugar transport system ATPase subunit
LSRPTFCLRCVDCRGAKRAIDELLTETASIVTAMLVFSNENDEFISPRHRIGVMHRGEITGNLSGHVRQMWTPRV